MAAVINHARAGGRKPGVPNRSTASLKAAFQKHEKALVKALIALTKSKSEDVRVRAIQACLDRGWGRVAQTVELPDTPAVVAIERIIVHTQPPAPNGQAPEAIDAPLPLIEHNGEAKPE